MGKGNGRCHTRWESLEKLFYAKGHINEEIHPASERPSRQHQNSIIWISVVPKKTIVFNIFLKIKRMGYIFSQSFVDTFHDKFIVISLLIDHVDLKSNWNN